MAVRSTPFVWRLVWQRWWWCGGISSHDAWCVCVCVCVCCVVLCTAVLFADEDAPIQGGLHHYQNALPSADTMVDIVELEDEQQQQRRVSEQDSKAAAAGKGEDGAGAGAGADGSGAGGDTGDGTTRDEWDWDIVNDTAIRSHSELFGTRRHSDGGGSDSDGGRGDSGRGGSGNGSVGDGAGWDMTASDGDGDGYWDGDEDDVFAGDHGGDGGLDESDLMSGVGQDVDVDEEQFVAGGTSPGVLRLPRSLVVHRMRR